MADAAAGSAGEAGEAGPAGPPGGAGPEGSAEILSAPLCKTRDEAESLGVALGPALRDACGDRLGEIEWFSSPWQRSGAATGRTWWRLPDGAVIPAIVKVPVGGREYLWSTRLGATDPMRWGAAENADLPVPRLLASGDDLGGHDIAWLLVERVPGEALSQHLDAESLAALFRAAADFHALAGELRPVERATPPAPEDWERQLRRAEAACRDNPIQRAAEWAEAVRATRAVLPRLLERWNARPIETWCHGDLHPGNAMIRPAASESRPSRAVLIDLALVHAGHWIEDALYIERLHWGREQRLCGVDPLAALVAARRARGLPADEHDAGLPDVRRVLMAATSPAYLAHEGDRVYLNAALDRLQALLPSLET